MASAASVALRPDAPATTPDGDMVAAVDDLCVTFRRNGKDVHALRGVSLSIAPGEIIGLVGESGSGKSVLGFSMLGLLGGAKTVGSVQICGTDMLTGAAKQLRKVRRLDLGAVFQDPMTSLNPTMRIGKQVEEVAGSSAEALKLLTAVGIPEPERRMRAYPHELSGGLRQRVMIAIAVAGNPELIIADEPTTALDVTVQAQVLALLQRLRAEIGCSIVLITHDLGVAAQIADRIAVLYAGRIAEIGPTADVLATPAHPYTHGLLQSRLTLDTARDRPLAAMAGQVPSPSAPLPGCAFVPRCSLARSECSVTPPDPTAVAPNRVSACIIEPEAMRAELAGVIAAETVPFDHVEIDGAQPPAVDVRTVTKAFTVRRRWLDRSGAKQSRLQALRGVSLTVAHGESVALVGESGSGKSTLLRIIAGLDKPTSGEVELAGKQRPQMVFQDAGASLTPWLSVGELIGERLRGTTMSRSARRDAVAAVLERVGLPQDVLKSRAAQLSGGQRQRVSLARATVIPPQVLLCDEPTSALDVSLAASVLNLIGELRRGLDMSVVFVTHDLSVARVVADRIAVMYLGRIVEIGPAEDVIGRPTHPYTQALVDAIPDLGRDCRVLAGEPASPLSPPTGCAFHPRCPVAIDTCGDAELDVRLEGIPGSPHQVACIERKAR